MNKLIVEKVDGALLTSRNYSGFYKLNYFINLNQNHFWIKKSSLYKFNNGGYDQGILRQVGRSTEALKTALRYASDGIETNYFCDNFNTDHFKELAFNLAEPFVIKDIVSSSPRETSFLFNGAGSITFRPVKLIRDVLPGKIGVVIFDHTCSETEGWFVKKYLEGWE